MWSAVLVERQQRPAGLRDPSGSDAPALVAGQTCLSARARAALPNVAPPKKTAVVFEADRDRWRLCAESPSPPSEDQCHGRAGDQRGNHAAVPVEGGLVDQALTGEHS